MGFAVQLTALLLGLASGLRLHGDNCIIPKRLRVVTVNSSDFGSMRMAVLAPNVDVVSRKIAQQGYWEIQHPRELGALAETEVPPNGTFLDIGANLGWYTVLFAKMGYNVLCIEPGQLNRQAIEATLCLNPDIADRVRLLKAAVVVAPEEEQTPCQTCYHPSNQGNGMVRCGSRFNPMNLRCEVSNATTLDHLLEAEGVESVDVVKMDIEGFECQALRGGQSLFNKYHVKLLQAEAKQFDASTCLAKEAEDHSYRLGHGHGHDDNRVISLEKLEKIIVTMTRPTS